MPITKEEAVIELVEWHYEIDPNMTEVIRLLSENENDPKEPIKFLEVSPDTPASGTVMTFTFGGTEEAPYHMRIAVVTPEEMDKVRRGEIPMPDGWDLENSKVYPAPTHALRSQLADAYATQSRSDYTVYRDFLPEAEECHRLQRRNHVLKDTASERGR